MQGLGKTTADLARYRKYWQKLTAQSAADVRAPRASVVPSRLIEVTDFGSNPGNLRMLTFVPDRRASAVPLVVVLHGCTQTGRGYDHGAGWSTLAERYGFALLVPEQQRENNPNVCFNWFQPGDTRRDAGEPLSIKEMVDWMIRHDKVDASRVFVTGLSAGGAMTTVMLATYPETFAGGAIIAGLPYGGAANLNEAFQSMATGRVRPAHEWGELVRAASPHRGRWPTVSVWHGTADATVKPVNAAEIVKQWTDVHGLPVAPSRRDKVDGHPRRQWRDDTGRVLVEDVIIGGMAHGTPLSTRDGETGCGQAGLFLLDVGISSSFHIAKSWGLTGERRVVASEGAIRSQPEPASGDSDEASGRAEADVQVESAPDRAGSRLNAVEAIINKALRSAGLMK